MPVFWIGKISLLNYNPIMIIEPSEAVMYFMYEYMCWGVDEFRVEV